MIVGRKPRRRVTFLYALTPSRGSKPLGKGCDILFGIGGDAVNGALLAAKENNLPAVGADVDEYNTYPEAQSALITSALKNVDIAVYNYLKSVADGSVQAGISTATVQNGVGPFP